MDLRQLSNFVRIIDAGSLSRAAVQIGVAQPALTFQIARLEEEFGIPLLIRSSRGVRPTDAGLVLYREARSALRHVHQIPFLVRNAGNELAGEVTVGFPSALAPFFAAPFLGCVRMKHPRVKLQLFESESAQLQHLLLNNRIELALLCQHGPAIEGLEREFLFTQRLALLCDRQDAGDRAGAPIPLRLAASRVVALPSVGNPIRAVVDDALRRNNLTVTPAVEANSRHTLIATVERGLGPAITVWMPLHDENHMDENHGLVQRPIVDPDLRLYVSVSRAKSGHLSPAAAAVRDILRDTVIERIAQSSWSGADWENIPP